MKKLLLLWVTLGTCSLFAQSEDKIAEAIKNSNPDSLRNLLMDGFYIRAEEKKSYETLSKKITKETHDNLHILSSSDIGRFIKGIIKLSGSALSSYAAYLFYKGSYDISSYTVHPVHGGLVPISQRVEDKRNRGGVYTALAFLASYFAYLGLSEFSAILGNQQRLIHHRDALAVEAIIARLPACDNDTSQTPKEDEK